VSRPPRFDYLSRQRHILLDMHVPDWDERLLARFDPQEMVEHYVRAGADAVMVYTNSHAGQCYWPTTSGRQHAGLRGRDIVGETLTLLHERGIAACAYYSANFNNWAYTEHPDWRMEPANARGLFGGGSRYGVCCFNNSDFLGFMLAQTEEIASAYPFDAWFYDMIFWTGICRCASCRARYRAECDAELPERVDWHSPEWCRFQDARERWLADELVVLRAKVKEHLDVPVFCNGALVPAGWKAGYSTALLTACDLVGGDFPPSGGGAFVFDSLASRITRSVTQYMGTVSAYGGGASQLRSAGELDAHACSAALFGAQFMAIDAVELDGSVNPATYDRIGLSFEQMRPFADHLGGRPIADVAVYWSLPAQVSPWDNGRPIEEIGFDALSFLSPSPHTTAVLGSLEALRAAHLPVGVITKADLGDLDEFRVVVLPNVVRMDIDEIEAFRSYVHSGGRLYVSGTTSLLTTHGAVHDDFLLADVFGMHRIEPETASVTFVRPAHPQLQAAIDPLRVVPHGPVTAAFRGLPPVALRVAADPGAEILARLTLPYAGGRGTRDDRDWASIHASPPWEDTDHPTIVRHRFGDGEAVYAALDIESSNHAVFTALVRMLLGSMPSFEADAHPDVWVVGFHDESDRRVRIGVLNHPSRFPALPVPCVVLRLSTPDRHGGWTTVTNMRDGSPMAFSVADDGTLTTELRDLQVFEMVSASYEIA
jgi:putative glycosyl hydrolase-like family 6 (GHL6) protein